MSTLIQLKVDVPSPDHYRSLISCQKACPVRTDARGYVRAIAEGRYEEAYLIARGPNPFASICGRICGAPCEAACRRGKIPRLNEDGSYLTDDRPVAIRALKRFACEWAGPERNPPEEVLRRVREYQPKVAEDAEEMAALLRAATSGRLTPAGGDPVAVIGAGPAGLSAAHDLALLGLRPVVFESEPLPAGMLALGVPSYRLPRELIFREVGVIQALGVDVRCGVEIGKDLGFDELRREFRAIIVAVGAKSSRGLGLPGERGPGVYGGVDLLRSAALGQPLGIGRHVIVIGGGNVAYDVARTVQRQIAWDTARTAARLAGTGSVCLVSLETLEEMPADTVEILEGDEEGIERLNGWGPLAIERDSDGTVRGVAFRRCRRVYDENRRFAPIFDDADRRYVPCDTVLLAVGQVPNLGFLAQGGEDLEAGRLGWPKVDPKTLGTSAPGIFVAGDLAHGTRLLIDAVASGKAAARSVYRYLTGRSLEAESLTAYLSLPGYRREPEYELVRRIPVPTLDPRGRLSDSQTMVELGFNEEQARREASRCLDCGVTPVFDGNRCVLCGGCVDVCPTQCLKIVPLGDLWLSQEPGPAILGLPGAGSSESGSAILKDEDRCIRCAQCVQRCPVEAVVMERVQFSTLWRSQ